MGMVERLVCRSGDLILMVWLRREHAKSALISGLVEYSLIRREAASHPMRTIVTDGFQTGLAALFVWLLLLPTGSRSNTPLTTWQKAGTYVDEEACEHEIKINLAGARNIATNPGEISREQIDGTPITDSSVCISEDDPRLR